ncbi:MAG: glycosyltransferase family 2 protein [Rhodothermales bacterium]|nr:glycosyltransferase family 2 protein [Rhodothermales bacterium]
MTKTTPTVSIIVVSYNTREMTLECLRSLVAETQEPYEVIVVDNASSDGSAEAIAANYPEIVLMAEAENHGFAKANNIAAKRARGEYILLLNPDTVVLDGAIDKLVDFARARPEAKIWGGRTLHADGTLNRTCCHQRLTLWKIFCRATGLAVLFREHRLFSQVYGGWDMNDIRPVDIVTGCFLLIPRRLWEDLGGFDLTYFMYGEEADLCLRATNEFGADPHFTPDAQIIHYGGASEPVRADKVVRLFKAKMTLIRHHFPQWKRPLGRSLFRMVPLGRYVGRSVVGAVTRRPGTRQAAQVWGEIWARRSEWQNGWPEASMLVQD